MKWDTGGYLVLDMRSGLMDGTYREKAAAQEALKFFSAIYPTGEWLLVQRVAYCGEYPGIPDERWAYKLAPAFYGFADMVAATEAYEARQKI